MKKEVAKKWVKALRSGKYKQGKGYLKKFNSKNKPRHCCLGVLCELYNDTMKKNHKKTLETRSITKYDSLDGDQEVFTFDGFDTLLPIEVRRWAGIKNDMGTFTYTEKDTYGTFKITESLADLNDTGKKFSTIADIIEKNIENI